jgi:Rieske Fe-S protein
MSVDPEESGPDRRSLMKAAVAVAVPIAGVGMVAACSSGKSSSSPANSGGNTPTQVPVAEVPVGGGTVVDSAKVVVTQPAAGEYKAFSAICTHAGCTVSTVTDNQIHCPCHGSIFSAADGSVISGPAPSPLSPLTAKVNGANVDVVAAAS